MAEREPRQRREVWYQGVVQGVGFRYTSRQIATGFQVTGFVRNLLDGRVYLVVEGEPTELDRFLTTLGRQMARFIDHVEQTVGPATGEFSRFDIRH